MIDKKKIIGEINTKITIHEIKKKSAGNGTKRKN